MKKKEPKKKNLQNLEEKPGKSPTSLELMNKTLTQAIAEFAEYRKKTDERFNALATMISQLAAQQPEQTETNPKTETETETQAALQNPIAQAMLMKLMAPEKSMLEKAIERSMLESITFDRIMRKAILSRMGATFGKEFSQAITFEEEKSESS
ncbi:MAG: hypothetical protein QMD13_09380 [Candidatus Bathyarchaeia archaeon]|nr:hypothetical protein [Candidatus Bathyarchaeia archaeon]